MPRGTSFSDEAVLQGRQWSPENFGDYLQMQLEVSAVETIVREEIASPPNSTRVSIIRSKGGRYGALFPWFEGYRPLNFGNVTLNGKPVMPPGWFDHRHSSAMFQNRSHAMAVCFVKADPSQNDYANGRWLWCHGTGTNNHPSTLTRSAMGFNPTDGLVFVSHRQTGEAQARITASLDSEWTLWSVDMAFADGAMTVYKNGEHHDHVSYPSTGNSSDVSISSNAMCIGNRFWNNSDTGSNWRGFWAHISFLARTSGRFSIDDRQRMEGYILHRWGMQHLLPGSHPYANRAPLVGA